MTFVCLGYRDEAKWQAFTESERSALREDGFAYDAELRRGGYLVDGQGFRCIRQVVTLRHRDGQIAVTDGPHAEVTEQLGSILLLEARDLNHAIRLMSWHPRARAGAFEIRAVGGSIHEDVTDDRS